jgi:hypothetical protein
MELLPQCRPALPRTRRRAHPIATRAARAGEALPVVGSIWRKVSTAERRR